MITEKESTGFQLAWLCGHLGLGAEDTLKKIIQHTYDEMKSFDEYLNGEEK